MVTTDLSQNPESRAVSKMYIHWLPNKKNNMKFEETVLFKEVNDRTDHHFTLFVFCAIIFFAA